MTVEERFQAVIDALRRDPRVTEARMALRRSLAPRRQ
jgi:hypothetical protein